MLTLRGVERAGLEAELLRELMSPIKENLWFTADCLPIMVLSLMLVPSPPAFSWCIKLEDTTLDSLLLKSYPELLPEGESLVLDLGLVTVSV